jgi:hypothetical protein
MKLDVILNAIKTVFNGKIVKTRINIVFKILREFEDEEKKWEERYLKWLKEGD